MAQLEAERGETRDEVIDQPDLPFLSPDAKVGNPPLDWADFQMPRLRRFPGSRDDIKLQLYLGQGLDGMAIKAWVRGENEPVVVKIFHFNRQPLTIYYEAPKHVPDPRFPYQRYSNPPPVPTPSRRYWAFKRESVNCAVLEKIEASLSHAAAAQSPIYLDPWPTRRKDAIRNLWAFSSEGRASNSEHQAHFIPFAPHVQINVCRGWTEFRGRDIISHLRLIDGPGVVDFNCDETYYAIIYAYVPREIMLDVDTIIAQMSFFHTTGFDCEEFNFRNWHGTGTLIDFSDLICPSPSRWWYPTRYADPDLLQRARVLINRFLERRFGPQRNSAQKQH